MRRLFIALVAVALVSSCSGGGDNVDEVRPETPPDTSTIAPTTTVVEPPTTTTTLPPDLDAVSVRLVEVAGGLASPVAIAFRAGDDRPWVAEQSGRVRVVENGAPLDPPVLAIDVSTGNEQGLLGLVFSPDGTKLYVDYTDPGGHTHVDEYTMNGDAAGNRRELLFVEQPYANHNGGQLAVDGSGMLYVALGDGGAGGDPEDRAQNRENLLGKILRIDPTGDPYAVPADNPFVGDANARPEIWMWGLRNPWRFTFDRATGDMWIADVGQNAWEEIDYAPAGVAAGVNWGWDEREGFHSFEGESPEAASDPIAERPLGEYCALIGGYVYRGAAVANMHGVYLFTDHCRGVVEALVQEGGAVVAERELDIQIDQPTSFGEDHDGELYVVSRAGTLYRFENG